MPSIVKSSDLSNIFCSYCSNLWWQGQVSPEGNWDFQTAELSSGNTFFFPLSREGMQGSSMSILVSFVKQLFIHSRWIGEFCRYHSITVNKLQNSQKPQMMCPVYLKVVSDHSIHWNNVSYQYVFFLSLNLDSRRGKTH